MISVAEQMAVIRRGAGHRLKQIMRTQLAKPVVKIALFARQYLVHNGFQVVVNTTATNASKKIKGTLMGIKYHLLCFPRIRYG